MDQIIHYVSSVLFKEEKVKTKIILLSLCLQGLAQAGECDRWNSLVQLPERAAKFSRCKSITHCEFVAQIKINTFDSCGGDVYGKNDQTLTVADFYIGLNATPKDSKNSEVMMPVAEALFEKCCSVKAPNMKAPGIPRWERVNPVVAKPTNSQPAKPVMPINSPEVDTLQAR